MENSKPSEELAQFMFKTLDLAVFYIKDGVEPPTLFTDDKIAMRFKGKDSVKEVEAAKKYVAQLPDTSQMYAVVYDGYVTLDDKKQDAIMLEVGERGTDLGAVFGQRYQPKETVPEGFKLIGNPGYLGSTQNLFNGS